MQESVTLEHIVGNRVPLLAELNDRQGVVRDYVRMVVDGNATGMYLFGRPGTAKSYTVNEVLKTVGKAISPQRGHLTPIGLFELIEENPDAVIPLDDVTAVLDSDVARQILLAALESPSPRDRTRTRVVTYRRKDEVRRTPFRGGITCISNRELHDDVVLEAFKSRVLIMNYDPSDAQLGAMMLDIAEKGRLNGVRGSGRESGSKWPASSWAKCCGWAAASTCGCSSPRRCRSTSSGRAAGPSPTGGTWSAPRWSSTWSRCGTPRRAPRRWLRIAPWCGQSSGNTRRAESKFAPGNAARGSPRGRSTGGGAKRGDGFGKCQTVKVSKAREAKTAKKRRTGPVRSGA